jgi:hypothetical protein
MTAMDTLEYGERLNVAMTAVLDELASAQAKFGPMADRFEGAAVLQEEVDEWWHEIKHGASDRVNMLAEARQVCAMALRFTGDVCAEDPAEVLAVAATHARLRFPSPHAAYAHVRGEMARLWEAVEVDHQRGTMAFIARMVAAHAMHFLVVFGGTP